VRSGGMLICDRVPTTNDRGEPCKLDPELFGRGNELAEHRDLATVSTVSYGKGRCMMLGRDLDKAYLDAAEALDMTTEARLRSWLRTELRKSDAKPYVGPLMPAAETGMLLGEDTAVLVVVSHSEETVANRVRVNKLPFTPRHVVELPSHAPVRVKPSSRSCSLDVRLTSRQSKMIAFYPSKPAALKLSASDAARGKPLTYTVELRDDTGKPCLGHHLVDAIVRDSSGSVRTRFGGRWVTSKGALTRSVGIPVNAKQGKWTIECRAVGADLSATASPTVR